MTENPAKRRSSLALLEVGVILVIAVSLGAYVVQRATVARQKAVAGTLKAAGAKIKYGDDGSVRSIDLTAMPEDRIELDDIALLTELTAINLDHSETLDEHLAKLSGLERLTALHLVGTGITDAGCRHLAKHPAMRFLDLRADFVTDAGLAHVGKLTKLVELRLAQTWISDTGLKSLAGMKNLTTLDLRHTDISDDGLQHLYALKNLKLLRLTHSRATAEGVARLKVAMPEVRVELETDRTDPEQFRVRMRPPKYTGERDQISRLHISERAICREIQDLDRQSIPDDSDNMSELEAAKEPFHSGLPGSRRISDSPLHCPEKRAATFCFEADGLSESGLPGIWRLPARRRRLCTDSPHPLSAHPVSFQSAVRSTDLRHFAAAESFGSHSSQYIRSPVVDDRRVSQVDRGNLDTHIS